MHWGTAVAAAILVIFGVTSGARAQPVVGTVTELSGKATVHRGSQDIPITLNMPLQAKDRVDTDADGHVTYTLIDHSKTTVGRKSSTVIDEVNLVTGTSNRSSVIVTLLKGTIRSVVSSALGRAFNYETHTSNSIIAVRGTDFAVDYSEGKARPGFSGCGIYTDVRVFSGLVEVTNPARPNEKVEVSGGFATTVPCFAAPLPAGPLGLAAHPVSTGALVGSPPPACPPCPMGTHVRF